MEVIAGWQVIGGLLAVGVLVWGLHKWRSSKDDDDNGGGGGPNPGPPGGGGTPPQQMK